MICKVVQNGRFYRKQGRQEVISKRKGLFQARLFSLRGKSRGVLCRVSHLPFGRVEGLERVYVAD